LRFAKTVAGPRPFFSRLYYSKPQGGVAGVWIRHTNANYDQATAKGIIESIRFDAFVEYVAESGFAA